MGKQLKYADRRGAEFAVIIGSEEREAGQAQIKDLKLGAQLADEITDNKTWREQQPAQFTVARGEIAARSQARLRAVNPELAVLRCGNVAEIRGLTIV
jgi:histidyl-tRNA synthetase